MTQTDTPIITDEDRVAAILLKRRELHIAKRQHRNTVDHYDLAKQKMEAAEDNVRSLRRDLQSLIDGCVEEEDET